MAENSTNTTGTNEFSINAPSITNNMLDDSEASAIGYSVQTTSMGADSGASDYAMELMTSPLVASTYDTSNVGYDANTAKGFDYNVTGNQTVQDQLQGIIAAESPLMQQAETRALQNMNNRGLLNSSMAAQAGQAALYDYAVPIASQDAKTYAEGEQFKAELKNQIEMFNVNAQNRAAEFKKAMEQEGGLANLAALNRASELDLTNKADVFKFLFGENVKMDMFDASERNKANQYVAETANTFTRAMLDQEFEARIASADAQLKTRLQTIDSVTRTELADIEAEFKQMMQTTSSAGDLFQQTMAGISELVQNPDLDADALDAAVGRELSTLKSSLTILEQLNPVIQGLADLLDLSEYETA